MSKRSSFGPPASGRSSARRTSSRPPLRDDDDRAEVVAERSGPSLWQRYDLGVVIFALALFAGGVIAHRSLTRPELLTFERDRLVFERPAGWLPGVHPGGEPIPLAESDPGADGTPASEAAERPDAFHMIYTSPWNARLRLEVRIAEPPIYKNLSGALSVARMAHYGEYYWVRANTLQTIANRDWLRTEFRYAFKANKAGTPEIADAVEYAIVDDEHLYQVTVHGAPGDMAEVDRLLRSTLRVKVAQEEQR